ncbi:SURF1 family protein [Streptomyces sp. XM4193]|uniref:SURF1 family cytochrome oxidase biogenesis protein n=1 Tax=Streptomyces sp. XM4193 TaxID=2929782 RepID=UPI001FF924E4|nr:SURF1 family protein [Streptomyces sp. XM4193]MCK1796534.1 SURF1 family protein [Streptomyces sp. XM4193]
MYRFLLSRQWVILTLVALVLMPAMVELGFWQYHRHQERVAHNDRIAASLSADPVPVDELTGTDGEVTDRERYRAVTATGTYDTEHEVVVRRRTAEDGQSIGYFVLTPLVREDGTALLVNRGWVTSGASQTAFPEVPAAPKGEVTLSGRLMPDETEAGSGIKDRAGLPERQVMLMNSEQQAKATGLPVLRGYLQLTGTDPAPARGETAQPVPEPDHSGIGAHMAYAVQWWLFVAAVPVGWFVLFRREVRDRTAAAVPASGPSPAGGDDRPQQRVPDESAEQRTEGGPSLAARAGGTAD